MKWIQNQFKNQAILNQDWERNLNIGPIIRPNKNLDAT
jgi:hypothetical protein